MPTLILTPSEAEKIRTLPAALLEGWNIEHETGTAYESADVLKIRAGMARFDSFPPLRALVQDVAAKKAIDPSVLADMPESVLPELCFTIGAFGVTVLIAALIDSATTDDDLAGIEGLSKIRHDILETNASISFSLPQ